jgi:hypothetical protein
MARGLSRSKRIFARLQAVDGNESEEDARQIAGEPLAELREVRAGDQFENRQRRLGLDVPRTLLARVDEVIE